MNKIFYRFLLSYVLILLIPIICAGSLGYWWVGSILSEQTEESYEAVIKELSSSVDEQMKALGNLTIQLSSMPWVKKVMYMQDTVFDHRRMNVVELKNCILELKGYDIVNDFIDNIIIVFPRQKMVISSAGKDDADVFFNDVYKLEGYDYNKWETTLKFYGGSRVIGLNNLEHNGQHEKVLTYIQPIPSKDQKGHAYFLAFIKHKDFISRLERFQISADSSIYIIDKSNSPVIELNGKEKFLSEVKNLHIPESGKLSSIISTAGKKYFLFCRVSEVNQWKYITSIPYDIVMEKVSYIKNITIAIAIALTAVGFIIAYFLAVNNCDPLLNLVNTMKMRFSSKDVSSSNEYEFLKNSINMLLIEEDLLKRQAEQQKPFIRNASFLELLKGNVIKVKPYMEFLESVDVRMPYENFVTTVYILDCVRGINTDIQAKATEISGKHRGCAYFVEVSGNKKSVIINITDLGRIKELVEEIKLLLESSLNVCCLVGVGEARSSLSDLKLSYEEAEKAVEYKAIENDRGIIYYNKIKETNSSYYYYPDEKKVEILSALRRGNYESVCDAIDGVISINKNRGMSLNSGMSLYYSLIDTAGQALNNGITFEGKSPDSMETLEELNDYLFKLCKKTCNFVNENRTLQNDNLKANILRYIEENYNNPNLSLESIADFMSRSVPYMSKVFKEQLGLNFLDCLNRKRISKARELLDGQMTVNQIAVLVGYNNDVTFRRVFKKYEGITPGEYIMTNQQIREYKKQNENMA